MSTKRYINSNWPGLQEKVKLEQVGGDLEIDIDIEQQITQLQEARLAGELEKPEQLSIDPEKQISEWHLEKGLKTFLNNVEFEKEDLDKKIKEEDAKISALEEMFGGLIDQPKTEKQIEVENTEAISESSFNELSEEEKQKRAQARLNVLSELFEKKIIEEKIEQEKINQEKLEEERKQKLLIDSGLEKPKVEIDAKTLEAQKLVEEKYGQAGSLAVQGLMNASAKDIEADPEMVDKVLQHISEMKVANELDKDKMKSLKSIDSLDKLTKEFLNFKNLTSVQLSTVGGGFDTNKISSNLMPTTGSTFDLGSATRPWRKLYLSGGTLVVGDAEISGTEIAQLDGVTAGTATASKAVILDASSGITGLGTVSMTTLALGGEPVTASATELNFVEGVTGNIQTALDSKATKAFAIAQAVALG